VRDVGCCDVEFLSAVFFGDKSVFRPFPVFCYNVEGDAMGPVDYMRRHQWLFFFSLGLVDAEGLRPGKRKGGRGRSFAGKGCQARRKEEGFPLTLWWSALRWDEREGRIWRCWTSSLLSGNDWRGLLGRRVADFSLSGRPVFDKIAEFWEIPQARRTVQSSQETGGEQRTVGC